MLKRTKERLGQKRNCGAPRSRIERKREREREREKKRERDKERERNGMEKAWMREAAGDIVSAA